MTYNNGPKEKFNFALENAVARKNYHEYINKQYAKDGLLGQEAMEKASMDVITNTDSKCPFCGENTVKYKVGIFGYCYNCNRKVYLWNRKTTK